MITKENRRTVYKLAVENSDDFFSEKMETTETLRHQDIDFDSKMLIYWVTDPWAEQKTSRCSILISFIDQYTKELFEMEFLKAEARVLCEQQNGSDTD